MALALFSGLVVLILVMITMFGRRGGSLAIAPTVDAVSSAGLRLGTAVVGWEAVQRVAVVTKKDLLRRRTRFGFQIDVDGPLRLLLVGGEQQNAAFLRESHRLAGFDQDLVLEVLRRADPGPTTCFSR